MDTINHTPKEILVSYQISLKQAIKKYEDICLETTRSDEEKATALNSIKTFKEKLGLIETYCLPISEQKKVTQEDISNAMKITCWGNLMYCCGLGKNCAFRDIARAALHINDELYALKESFINDLLKATERLQPT